jgi:hypothetical protein
VDFLKIDCSSTFHRWPTGNRENRVRTVEFYKTLAVPSGAVWGAGLNLLFI